MTAGPGDEIEARLAARGRLRASHADREQVIGALKIAYVQGRLAKDELDLRVGQTLASRTYADLAALMTDLPAGLRAAEPVRKPAQVKVSKGIIWAASGLVTPALIGLVYVADTSHVGKTMGETLYLVMSVYFLAWLAAGAQLLDTWRRQQHSRGQVPPPRIRRDRTINGRAGRPGDDLMLCEARVLPAGGRRQDAPVRGRRGPARRLPAAA